MKKNLFLYFAVIMIVFSLLSCEKKGEVVSDDGRETFVLFTMPKSEAQTEAFIKYIIEPFEKENPTIKVDWQPTANADETLKIQMASGAGPDLMDLNGPTDAMEYYDSGRILDLSSAAEEYRWNEKFFDWSLSVCTTPEDELAGVPVAYEGMVFYYNKDIFAENGWTYPETREQFVDICIAAEEKGLLPVSFGSSGFNRLNEWWISTFMSAYSTVDEMNSLLTGKIDFTDPEIKTGFELFVEYWNNGWISNRDSFAVGYEDARSLFTQGRAAFIMEGTWYYQTVSQTDVNYGIELFPSFKDGKDPSFPIAVSRIMAVNKDSEHQDAAIKFIDFMINNEDAYIKSVVEGSNQPLPIESDLTEYTSQMEPMMGHMTNVMTNAQAEGNTGYCLWTFFPQATRIYLYEKLDGVLLGDITLDEYLEEAQKILDNDIKEGNVPRVM